VPLVAKRHSQSKSPSPQNKDQSDPDWVCEPRQHSLARAGALTNVGGCAGVIESDVVHVSDWQGDVEAGQNANVNECCWYC
jgi:hypothetical protein